MKSFFKLTLIFLKFFYINLFFYFIFLIQNKKYNQLFYKLFKVINSKFNSMLIFHF